jgi:hypothetical protein
MDHSPPPVKPAHLAGTLLQTMMVPALIVHEKTVGKGRLPFSDWKKNVSARQFAMTLCARCTRDLGNSNNILKQEVRLCVFLSGQARHVCRPILIAELSASSL